MGCRAVGTTRTGSRAALSAVFSAVLLALVLLLAMPAVAHEEHGEGEHEETAAKAQYTPSESKQSNKVNGQVLARATGPLADATATLTDDDDVRRDVDRITIPVADCTAPDAGVTVTIGQDGEQATISNSQGNNIEAQDDQVIITGLNGEDIVASGINGLEEGSGNVVRSSGISCERADDGASGDGEADGDGLNCEQLLQRFRGVDDAQYVGVDVGNQIAICLEQEVEQNTAVGGDLPDTGGPSLVGLAVLGVGSALAGFSLIRGSRRED